MATIQSISASSAYITNHLHGIVCNTECSTLHAYLMNQCYMASSETPSVLLYLPTSRTIVTWHRLQRRVFYFICLPHEPLLHGIDCNTDCSTLPAYITDHCYMALSPTPSVLLYLPTSRTILHAIVCNTEYFHFHSILCSKYVL